MSGRTPRHGRRRSPARRALRALAWMAAGGALVVIAGVVAARIALPWLDDEPEWAASWLSQQLSQDVELERLEFAMEGLTPVLRLSNVRIRSRATGATHAVALDNVKVELSPLDTLRQGVLHPRRIRIVGAELHLVRSGGQLVLRGFGGQSGQPAEAVMAAAASALPRRSELTLEDARVVVESAHPGRIAATTVLEPVGLRLAASERQLMLSGTIGPRAQESLRFQLRWPTAVETAPAMDLTMTARSFPLERLALPIASGQGQRLHGRMDMDLQGQISDGQLEQARGSIRVGGLFWSAPGAQASSAAPTSAVSALFDFSRIGTRWRLDLPRVTAGRGDADAPGTSARIEGPGTDESTYALDLESIAIRDALQLARSLVPSISPYLSRIGSAGRIEDLELVLAARETTLEMTSVRAAVKGFELAPGTVALHVSPLDARIEARGSHGTIQIEDVAIDLPGRPEDDVPKLRAVGKVDFSVDPRGMSLRATTLRATDGAVNLTLTGTARWSNRTHSLACDLTLSTDRISAEAFVAYLGSGIDKPRLDAWLRRAIPEGELAEVGATLLGTFSRPEELVNHLHASGRFYGLTLDYAPSWPPLKNLEGRIAFDAGRVEFQIDSGEVSHNRIRDASGQIESVLDDQPSVAVRGTIAGDIERGSEFLLASALRPRFEGLLKELEARGPATLDLSLQIPVIDGVTRVEGALALTDNTVAMPAVRADMSAVQGLIEFDESGLTRGSLEARYLDQPITASLTGASQGRPSTALEIRGRTTPRGLLRHLYAIGALDSDRSEELPLLARLSGETAWTVALSIPTLANPDRSLGLAVRSDLAGMSLDLPAPLGKSAASSRVLDISTRLDGKDTRRFSIAYGDRARAAVEVVRGTRGYRLSRARVRVGGGDVELPTAPGLSVVGEVATVSVDEWLALVGEAAPATQATENVLGDVQSVEVQAGRLRALGLGFDDVRLSLDRVAPGLIQVALEGPRIAGAIRIPEPLAGATVTARFDRLLASTREPARTQEPGSAAASSLNVRRLPAIDAKVARLGYAGIELGQARLDIRPAAHGLDIERLEVTHPDYRVEGRGHWSTEAGRDRTQLALTLRGDDLGRALRAFGYSDSGVTGAPLELQLEGEWPGSPLAFSLDAMTGTLGLSAGKGRIVGIEPGATGRVFGLLSVTLLPRRLFSFDFSDLFGEGIGFNRMAGEFTVRDGNAWTQSLALDTDTATVTLEGRVGLVSRDYDQVMTVSPKLSSSLPLAPLWLAEQVLDRKLLDPAFARRYTVTGSWDNPQVERIKRVIEEAGSSADR